MAAPSIVPIAITIDDRTGYTLWAPPWEEDGEQWQAFLGAEGRLHLFDSERDLAAYSRTASEHDLDDHPVWPIIAKLAARDLTPDDDHRYDLDGLYELVAENPDRWSVGEVADTIDIVSRIAECCSATRIVRDLEKVPEIGLLAMGADAFVGREGENSWTAVGKAVDEHWETVLTGLGKRIRWPKVDVSVLAEEEKHLAAKDAERTGKVAQERANRRGAAGKLGREVEDSDRHSLESDDDEVLVEEPVTGTAVIQLPSTAWEADADEVDEATEFWESVGILPVELTLPEGSGLTLRCYVEDSPRFLGSKGRVYLFRSADGLGTFIRGKTPHDLRDIATWADVVESDVAALPAEEDRYDLAEVAELFGHGASTDIFDYSRLAHAFDGALDVAEYAELDSVDELVGPTTPLGQALVESQRGLGKSLAPADTAAMATAWEELVDKVSGAVRWHD
ncbi:MAG: hypothetical protein H0T54_04725 [Geodermatophilaceae bacterium]|nr:hypothetical protein [Geodermatophilaceae bacterium]